eukprot:scaffold422090_cov18-Prasinocladus_malaysianus.AAC.1
MAAQSVKHKEAKLHRYRRDCWSLKPCYSNPAYFKAMFNDTAETKIDLICVSALLAVSMNMSESRRN